ncbi:MULTISPECIES: cytochrome P450 [Streptomyces]|uniref:cytochrome P450 n=1 Tax=Streptomyces sp. SYP-A7185 TaxID=3040076 RepID=UPI0038F605D5
MTTAPSRRAQEIFDPAHRPDPYPLYAAVREAGPVHPMGPRIHLASRHADCSKILGDPLWGHGYGDRISPFRPGVGREEVPGSLLGMDPPDHTRLHRLISKAFKPARIESLRARVEQIVDQLLDAALEAGEVDLVDAFNSPLPLTLVCELIGVPTADMPLFRQWSTAIVRGVDPDYLLSPQEITARYEAEAAFEEYFKALAEDRRAHHRGDLLSDLVAARENGDILSDHELHEIGAMLMVAGHETTVNALGTLMIALHRNPRQRARVTADPGLVPAAVEEGLRHDPPIQFTSRVALEEREFAGRTFARGDGIILMVGAANRDPAAFPDPETFDVTRHLDRPPGAPRHLTFSNGPHRCLGAQLARMEMQIALRALLTRAPHLELLTDEPPYRDLYLFRGPLSLPVRMRP